MTITDDTAAELTLLARRLFLARMNLQEARAKHPGSDGCHVARRRYHAMIEVAQSLADLDVYSDEVTEAVAVGMSRAGISWTLDIAVVDDYRDRVADAVPSIVEELRKLPTSKGDRD